MANCLKSFFKPALGPDLHKDLRRIIRVVKSFKNDFPAIHNSHHFSEFSRKLSRLGARLGINQVTELESNVESNAWDLKSRALLLGYYHRNKEPLLRQRWLVHLGWIVTHRPDHDLAARFYDPTLRGDEYSELKSIWQRQVALHPSSAAIQMNAARFLFYADDKELADQVLTSAIEMNASCVELRARQIRFYTRWPGKELEALNAIDRLRKDCKSADISYELEKLPAIAFAAGHESRAIEAADELLEEVKKKPKYRDVERITNEVHTVLGKIALKHGDVKKARWHLYESLPLATSKFTVPSFELAKSLVLAGESHDVTAYLDKVEKVCPPLLEDAFRIRFQIEHGLKDSDDSVNDWLLRPQYEKALLDHKYAVLIDTKASLIKTVLERELKNARSEVAYWSAQINDSFYAPTCTNLCLEIHQEHLRRIETFASELSKRD